MSNSETQPEAIEIPAEMRKKLKIFTRLVNSDIDVFCEVLLNKEEMQKFEAQIENVPYEMNRIMLAIRLLVDDEIRKVQTMNDIAKMRLTVDAFEKTYKELASLTDAEIANNEKYKKAMERIDNLLKNPPTEQ